MATRVGVRSSAFPTRVTLEDSSARSDTRSFLAFAIGEALKRVVARPTPAEHTVEKHVKNILGSLRLPLSPDDHGACLPSSHI